MDPEGHDGHELRFDPLTGEWVLIVPHRQSRPNLPASGCPFCVGGLEAPLKANAQLPAGASLQVLPETACVLIQRDLSIKLL